MLPFNTDHRQLFIDCGQPVTLRQIDSAYDPATQQLAETLTDTPLTAIVGPAANEPLPGTAAQQSAIARTFMLQSSELPADFSPNSSRLLHSGTEYDILTATTSANDQLTTCQTRSSAPPR